MKKILNSKLFVFALIIISVLGISDYSYAIVGDPPSAGSFGLQNPLSGQYNTVGGLVSGFMDIFSYLVIIFAVLMLIWVGLQFILARGNPSKMTELKVQLLWIVVGVAVVIGARIIVSVVISTLNASGAVSTSVINSAQNAVNNQ